MRPCIFLCRGAAVFAVFFILPLRRFWGNTCNRLRLRHDIMYFLQIENQNLSITELKLRLSLCRICLSSPKMQNPLQISMLRIVLRFSPNLCKKVSAIKYQARKLLPCCIPATQKSQTGIKTYPAWPSYSTLSYSRAFIIKVHGDSIITVPSWFTSLVITFRIPLPGLELCLASVGTISRCTVSPMHRGARYFFRSLGIHRTTLYRKQQKNKIPTSL